MGAEQSLIGGGLDADDICVICEETGEKKLLKEQPIIMEEREVTRKEFNSETRQTENVTKKVKLPKEMPEVPDPDEIIENASYQRLQPDGFIIDKQLPVCTNKAQHYVHYTCLRNLVLQAEPSRKQLDEQQLQQQEQAKLNSQLFEQLPGSQVIEGYKEDIEDIICPECRAPLMSEVVNMIKKSSFYKEKRKKVVEKSKNKERFYISMNRRYYNNNDIKSWVFYGEKIYNYEFITNEEEFTENYNKSVKMNIPLFSGIENLSAEKIIKAYNEGLVGFSAYIDDDDNEVAELLYSRRNYDDSIETIKNNLLEVDIQENVAEAISTISFNNRDDEKYPGSVKFVFDSPDEYTRLMNLIRKEQFADAKELMFNYTMDNVEVNYENLMQQIEMQMEQEQEEENDIYNFIETLRMHNIYDSLIRKGNHDEAMRLRGDYEVTSRDERVLSRYRNALDINLYIDYANSPAYNPDENEEEEELNNDDKLDVMEQLDSIVNALGFPEDNLSKNSRIIEIVQGAPDNEAIQNLKAMLLDYTIRNVQDVNYGFIYDVLSNDGYWDDNNLQDMIYMHGIYDDLIRTGEDRGIEKFIARMETGYFEEKQKNLHRDALDINPYLDYVNSAEYVHPEKDYVIEIMNKLRDVLGFTGMQQGGQTGHTVQASQYGGMWQRGGFFMTCS